MSKANPYNLPLLDGAYDIASAQFIRIEMSGETLLYNVLYPSGLAKYSLKNYEVERELKRYCADPERIEEIIRYASEWRRIHYYPDTGLSYPVFPNGQEYRGGAGNHTSFGRDFIWNKEEEQ